MAHISRRTSLAILGTIPVAGVLPRQARPRTFLSKSSRDVLRDRHFPNVLLFTHDGRKVRFYDDLIKDKIVVINFMYAECEGVCPGITANLAKVQKALGDRIGRDIFMYSITLQPRHDTPRVLNEYARMHDAGPGWVFLTGDPDDIERLRRSLGFTDPDPDVDTDKSNHIGNVRYGNEPMQWWGACPGLADPEWITESILFVDWPKTDGERK